MVAYDLILDVYYICTCIKGSNITLNCKDSFCSGCIVGFIYKDGFDEESVNKEIFPDVCFKKKTWDKVKIRCPKCLTISEIGNYINNVESMKLHCGCIVNRNNWMSIITINRISPPVPSKKNLI